MAQSQNTVQEIFVASAATVLAADADLGAFSDATDNDGEIFIGAADGGAATGAGVPFVIATKIDGNLVVSDKYTAEQVKRAIAKTYAAPALRSFTVAPTNLTVGTEYITNLRIMNYGSLSPENFYVKHAQYTVQTSDTQENISTGLVTSLKLNFSSEAGATATSNPYFSFYTGYTTGVLTVDTAPDSNEDAIVTIGNDVITVALLGADTADNAATKIAAAIDALPGYSATDSTNTVTIVSADSTSAQFNVSYVGGATNSVASYVGTAATALVVIQEKEQALDLGRDEGRPLSFDVTVPDGVATVGLAEGGNPGAGTGKQVALLENFARGNRGDAFRKQHYPYNWSEATKTVANSADTYSLIELVAIHSQNDTFNVSNSRKQATIAVPTAAGAGGVTEINSVINALEAYINQTVADLSDY